MRDRADYDGGGRRDKPTPADYGPLASVLSDDRLCGYTNVYREILGFTEDYARIMMRDYKFRQTEWPRRKTRNATQRILAVLLAGLGLALLVYAGVQWLATRPAHEGTVPSDARVIPLTIPPEKPAQLGGDAGG